MADKVRNTAALYKKALTHEVMPIPTARQALQFKVVSGSSGNPYVVNLLEQHVGRGPFRSIMGTCTCKWGDTRSSSKHFVSGCSHVIAAVRFWLIDRYGLVISCWTDIVDAVRQHKAILRSGDGIVFTARPASKLQKAAQALTTGLDSRDRALPVQYKRGKSVLFKS